MKKTNLAKRTLAANLCRIHDTGNGKRIVASEERMDAKRTEYPVTITTYDGDGSESETTYERAPLKVLAATREVSKPCWHWGLRIISWRQQVWTMRFLMRWRRCSQS